MADRLKVSTEAFNNAISSFETSKMGLENSYLKISNEVRVLDGTWHGDASEQFKGQFDELYKNLQQTETAMSNVITKLKSALSEFESEESSIQGLINNADTGTAYPGFM